MDVALWARFKELGLSTAVLFGFVQVGFSVSRILGIGFWKKLGVGDSRKLALYSLFSSSFLYLFFPFINSPTMAAAIWFGRIFLLASFFSAMNSLVLSEFRKDKLGATSMSVYSVFAGAGSAMATLSIGFLGNGFDTRNLLFIGAIFSFLAGLPLLFKKRTQT